MSQGGVAERRAAGASWGRRPRCQGQSPGVPRRQAHGRGRDEAPARRGGRWRRWQSPCGCMRGAPTAAAARRRRRMQACGVAPGLGRGACAAPHLQTVATRLQAKRRAAKQAWRRPARDPPGVLHPRPRPSCTPGCAHRARRACWGDGAAPRTGGAGGVIARRGPRGAWCAPKRRVGETYSGARCSSADQGCRAGREQQGSAILARGPAAAPRPLLGP